MVCLVLGVDSFWYCEMVTLVYINLHVVFGFACVLKGSFTIFLFSVRTHILDSYEVWYS